MRFSIIVPIYKVADYLDDCVQSVKNQTYTDWELILVDDGSPDACPQMCDGYAKEDARIRVVHKPNGGLSNARNAGLDRAKGEYVLLLDGDDFYNRSDMFEMLSANIDKSSADVILFGCTDWNMKTGEMRISRSGYNLPLINEGQNRTDILHYLFSQKKLPGGATISAVSRHLIEEHSIRFHCGIQSEDHDFVLNVFVHCKKVFAMDEPFYTYRLQREGSITHSGSIKMIQGIDYTLNKWVPILSCESNDQLRKDYLNYLAFIYSTGIVITGRLHGKDRKESLELMRKHRSILKYGYWRDLRIVRLASSAFGLPLFTILGHIYYDRTHI